jgi:8-amino-7-oxononanoate synthase
VSARAWTSWVHGELGAIRAAGRWRAPRALAGGEPATKLDDGTAVVSFASNDYLGLSQHAAVVGAAHRALDQWGAGSGSARLIVGARAVHSELEAELAAWKREGAAVLFPNGFAANLGVLTVLGGAGTLLCSDELNHASIVDGCRLARGDVAVYAHRDLDHLDALLAAAGDRRAIVVTDTVFSMDGDIADIDALAALCARRGALLVLDEAHAVLGPDVDAATLDACEHIRVGTLSKTLGALGGFAAASRPLADLLVNQARPYIFTTASTPADTAAALAALGVLRSTEGAVLVARLRTLVDRVAGRSHPSPIVPVHCGEEQAALAAAAALLERGLLVPAIRPPTVPVGTARLRITLSAAHTDEQVDRLLAALASLQ